MNVDNLVSGYDGGFWLRDVSFGVERGEFFGIIGPNGSGKTTLLRAITKAIDIKEGRVIFDGRDVEKLSYKDLAKEMAFLIQNPTIEASMYVDEAVLLGRIPHKGRFQFFDTDEDVRIAEEAMELTDTLRLRNRRVGELSGGERQLVFIAKAVAQRPRLLFLDEPTSHLDIAHKIRILNLLRKLNRREGLTIIIILHDLNLASEYCQRLLLLENGSVHTIGTPDEVLTSKAIEEVYGAVVVVEKNPISHKPYIIAISEEMKA